jgi:hypothetical protein
MSANSALTAVEDDLKRNLSCWNDWLDRFRPHGEVWLCMDILSLLDEMIVSCDLLCNLAELVI